MAQEDKLDKVNATLDRFAKLIEENAQQLRKDKEEAKRQRAEDLAKEKKRQAEELAEKKKRQAEELAEKKKRQAEELAEKKKRQAEDQKRQAEWEKRQAEWERQQAEDRAKEEKRQAEWEKQRAEDRAKEEKRQAEWERQRAEDKAKDEEREARWEKRLTGINSRLGGQGNSIGEITEAMTVSDNILNLINKFDGIDAEHFYFNITKKYPAKNSNGEDILKQYEVDGLASGEKSVVVIEAKTILTEWRIQRLFAKLAKFKLAYPDHKDKDLYGAITFIRMDEDAFVIAKQHGLFLIKASPPDVELANGEGFIPRKII